MANFGEKNPISFLQEYCVQNNITLPKYSINRYNASTFTCTVEVSTLSESSSAPAKQAAKTEAANKMVKLLATKNHLVTPPTRTVLEKSTEINVQNAINQLQELCAKSKISLPLYEDDGKAGEHHLPQFWVKCTLGEYSERGTGSTKKIAKESAANKILQIVNPFALSSVSGAAAESKINDKRLFIDGINNNNNDDDTIIIGNARGRLQELCVHRKYNVPTFAINHEMELGKFHCTCLVNHEQTIGISTTKKAAIQISAQKMLDILEIKPKEIDISSIVKCIENEFPSPDQIVKVYRDYKKQTNRLSINNCNLGERHNYFKNLNETKKMKILNILESSIYDASEKVELTVAELNLKYEILPTAKCNSLYSNQMFVLNGDYDVVIIGNYLQLYENVVDYFRDMIK